MYQAPAPLCPTPPSNPLGSSSKGKYSYLLPETRGLTSISHQFLRQAPPAAARVGGGTRRRGPWAVAPEADTTLLTVMDVSAFCSQSRVLIVAGKGGVGKTTMVAALARLASQAGLSVLVVELEGRTGLSAAFGSDDPPG